MSTLIQFSGGGDMTSHQSQVASVWQGTLSKTYTVPAEADDKECIIIISHGTGKSGNERHAVVKLNGVTKTNINNNSVSNWYRLRYYSFKVNAGDSLNIAWNNGALESDGADGCFVWVGYIY